MIEYLYKFLALYNSSLNKYETFAFGLTYDEYAHNDIIHACMSITLLAKEAVARALVNEGLVRRRLSSVICNMYTT